MNIQGIRVGDKVSKYPIMQGGMGVGVSAYKLAGHVAKEGGIGIISAADIGYEEEDFNQNPQQANLRAIGKQIEKARKIAPNGIIGMNIMVAMNHYGELAKEAARKGIDLIVSGAGLAKDLPEYIQGTKTKIAPIISSNKAFCLMAKLWKKRYNYIPDMVIIEGPEAGGHLGFKKEELLEGTAQSLEEITKEVVEEVKKMEQEEGKEIPVIVAGGIFDGNDIAKFLKLGASGVQMATRFVATEECDASDNFKQAYVNAKQEDIQIIQSPVGMPGRAIRNDFIQKVEQGKEKITKCYNCIKTCDAKDTPYCITRALIRAVKGEVDEALVFCGSNAYRIKEIVPVKQLMEELMQETQVAMAI